MNRRASAAVALMALATAACSATSSPASSPTPSPTPQSAAPLVIAQTVAVTYTQDFNPFDPQSTASTLEIRSLVYEPLYEIDALTPSLSGMHPWLATGYAFEDGGTELRITVRGGLRLSDGTPFGPTDVAATFRAIRDDPAADYSGVPAQSVDPTISGRTVTLHFPTPQYLSLDSILGNTYMVPAALVTRLGADLTTGKVSDPVGTGPFVLARFSNTEMRFTANPPYWGGVPTEPEVDGSYYAAADAVSTALSNGTLDWGGPTPASGGFCNCGEMDPNTDQQWYVSGNTVTLDFNLAPGNGGATGIGDPQVRKAVEYGIDRNALGLLGEAGYEQPATSSGGLILPAQKTYLPSDGSLTNDLSTGGNVPDSVTAKADNLPTGDDVYDILTADGYTPPTSSSYASSTGTYTPGGNCTSASATNCWMKGGQDISFSVYDPIAFSDYWEDCDLISSELQGLGMHVTTKAAQAYSDWFAGFSGSTTGWQTLIHWGNGGSIPYIQFDDWFDTRGTNNSGAYTGYKNDPTAAQAQTLLQTYASTDPGDSSTLATTVQSLEQIMSTDVPYAPLLYGADWAHFSSQDYTGWPSASDPYIDPSPADPELPYVLMRLRPVPSS